MSTDQGPGQRGSSAAAGARALAGFVLFLGVVGAVVGVVRPVNQLTQPGGSVGVTIEDPAARTLDATELPPGVWLEANRTVTLQVSRLPAPLRLLTELSALLTGLLTLAGTWILRRVLLDVADGQPFAPTTPGRIAALAALVVVASVVPRSLDAAATAVVLHDLGLAGPGDPLGFTILSIDLMWLAAAAVLLVVSRVFAYGQQLREDTEGLV